MITKYNVNFNHKSLTLNQINSHINQLKLQTEGDFYCPICLTSYSKPVSYPCGRLICFDCMEQMVKLDNQQNTCMLCGKVYDRLWVQGELSVTLQQYARPRAIESQSQQRQKMMDGIVEELLNRENQENGQPIDRPKQDCFILVSEVIMSLIAIGTLWWSYQNEIWV